MAYVNLPKEERFTCRMDPETKLRLRLYASDHGITMSKAIEKLIWNAHVSKRMRRHFTVRQAARYNRKKFLSS